MANSRLGMETRAITEGALMATLTAIMAMAGIYMPMLGAILMTVWTLPVVIVCMRRGLRAGAASMAVAGLIILITTTPIYALEMLLRSAGPALLIGYGFLRRWKSEKTIFFAALAAFLGLLASFVLSFFLMGIGFDEFFLLLPETVDEMTAMLADYGLMDSLQLTPDELKAYIQDAFAMIKYLFPSFLMVAGLITAFTNYMMAVFVLGKLKISVPPVTKFAEFRLPLGFVFGFITGFGMSVVGMTFLPDLPNVAEIGQNIMVLFMALYFFQGLGLFLYYIGKAPPYMRTFWKIAIVLTFILTFFRFFSILCIIGLLDALFDFRKIEQYFNKKGGA